MITGNIIAVLFIAAIPWALALPVTRWHPAMQTAQARRSYRWFTYVVSLVFSVVSFFLLPLVLIWFIPVGSVPRSGWTPRGSAGPAHRPGMPQ
jgi:hypothetical protein